MWIKSTTLDLHLHNVLNVDAFLNSCLAGGLSQGDFSPVFKDSYQARQIGLHTEAILIDYFMLNCWKLRQNSYIYLVYFTIFN